MDFCTSLIVIYSCTNSVSNYRFEFLVLTYEIDSKQALRTVQNFFFEACFQSFMGSVQLIMSSISSLFDTQPFFTNSEAIFYNSFRTISQPFRKIISKLQKTACIRFRINPFLRFIFKLSVSSQTYFISFYPRRIETFRIRETQDGIQRQLGTFILVPGAFIALYI